jgi:hypothetical protein
MVTGLENLASTDFNYQKFAGSKVTSALARLCHLALF